MGRAHRLRLSRRRHQRPARRDCSRADGKIEFIQVRHEEMAAFMASAYAKFTGELGVCIATSGPGASHLITGLYDARLDHMPVLAIAGQQARSAVGGHYQQELDLRQHVQGRGRRLRAAGDDAGAGPPSGRPRDPHRARRAPGDRADLPQRPAGHAVRGAAAQARHGAFRHRLHARRGWCPTTRTCSAPPTCSTPARRSRSWSAPAPCTPPTR